MRKKMIVVNSGGCRRDKGCGRYEKYEVRVGGGEGRRGRCYGVGGCVWRLIWGGGRSRSSAERKKRGRFHGGGATKEKKGYQRVKPPGGSPPETIPLRAEWDPAPLPGADVTEKRKSEAPGPGLSLTRAGFFFFFFFFFFFTSRVIMDPPHSAASVRTWSTQQQPQWLTGAISALFLKLAFGYRDLPIFQFIHVGGHLVALHRE
eukprot:FR740426.1.p2 GENE.FR740426.1~~FR740426.1.p2  ORF type:complete len:204 (-),score=43.54 FR740426.1:518-1129(-)